MTPTALVAAFAALFGLVIGSFLTVVVHRVPRGESIVAPRSSCPSCGSMITARDNVPVVSWVVLRGRCRTCGHRISFRYPLTEALTGALFVAAAVAIPSVYVAVVIALFLAVLFAASLIDIERKIIPNRIVYPSLIGFAALVIMGWAAGQDLDLAGAGLGFLAFGGGLLVVALFFPRGMGMGDVKLAALIGLVLGSLGLRYVGVAAAAGIVAGGIGSLVALAAGFDRKHAIPFGPYLSAGALAAALFGSRIAAWYLSLGR
jgi:leader peptidase (prepilin peptidase)/N-methyltransferase